MLKIAVIGLAVLVAACASAPPPSALSDEAYRNGDRSAPSGLVSIRREADGGFGLDLGPDFLFRAARDFVRDPTL